MKNTLDIILTDHSRQQLEETFDAVYLFDHPLFSLMAERTQLPWFLIVPKQSLDAEKNPGYAAQLYGEIYRLIGFMQKNSLGNHFNLAKIGNKNPYLHIHLIFREENDEVWPDAVWCHEPLNACEETPLKFKQALAEFFAN
ncbi:hypothetical protein QCB44_09895 [Thiomicrorhabdus sp. zzn3]|uniref:hypothetical protein n=1 Tax=Thiomicrorhabdus sp. zzn3 TaxID=3039775 RepID=UPI0024366988|nr:hypothetical protein [Thiomicrorhabdus sp. zzn3]MDG6779018.1 hypothetical protein [Thiomicrorhabdus sp. zzn3]